MTMNPVFREGVEIYLIEGHGFAAYFYTLILIALLQFLTLFLPSLDPQMWMGPANLFKTSTVAALVLISYFLLRVANQEYVPWRFLPLRRWFQQESLATMDVALAQLALLCLHALIFVFLSAPLLIWAAAISRASGGSLFFTLILLLLYSLTYGVWGLVALTVWERRIESRQVFIRSFFLFVVFLSALLYLPLNPIAFLLAYLGRKDMTPLILWGWKWSAGAVHFLFHFFILGSGLMTYWWTLRREVSL